MSLSKRLALLSKATTVPDRAEDPRETLEYSYNKQQGQVCAPLGNQGLIFGGVQ